MAKPQGNFTTHQLQILTHLLHTQNVTETAMRFNTSQPSVSRLLAEMRHRFNDQLLVRSGDRMIATDRGRLVREEIDQILDRVGKLLDPEDAFDFATSDRQFSLGFTDSNIASLGPAVVAAIAKEGPAIRTRLWPVSPSMKVVEALESRDLDVVVDCVTEFNRQNYEQLRFFPLVTQDVVLLSRQGHPIETAPPQSLEAYHRLKHVAPSSIPEARKDPIGETLNHLSHPRHIFASVPDYNLIPFLLLETDLVFTTSREFAERFARYLPLAITPAPDFFPQLEFRLLWHEVTDQSPSCVWLRQKIVAAAKMSKNSYG